MYSYIVQCTYGAIGSNLIVKVSSLKIKILFKKRSGLELPVFGDAIMYKQIRINLPIRKLLKNFRIFCDKKERQVPRSLPAFSLVRERPSASRFSCNTNMSL